ncbi:MAG: sugar MFS transporter [Acidobacteriia bacterium]|nr:sugar MFS transporter [Terriglobia bacterium]
MTPSATAAAEERSRRMVGLLFLIFFVMSLLTNVLAPIIPDILQTFRLSLTAAGFLPFSFFVAYGVMSIPAGLLISAYSEKTVIVAGFAAATCGALSFAVFPVYSVAVVSLFVIGCGMAMLQVSINPLLRVSGGEENMAFNSALAQLIFGSASFLSPILYSYLVQHVGRDRSNLMLAALARLVPEHLPWVSLYWLFTVISGVMMITLWVTRFPAVQLKADEKVGTWPTHRTLLRNRIVLLYFISTFAYVGSEQGTADWMSQFLATYHHFDPQTSGAYAVSWFWGLLTAGCLSGLLLLKIFDSARILTVFSVAAIVTLSAALFGPGSWALIAFPLIGLFASLMWPVIISLALNSLAEHHGSFSGILCTGIAGGAVVPLLIGRIGDRFGLRAGMTFLYLTFGWVLSVGFWANPLVKNKTIRARAE